MRIYMAAFYQTAKHDRSFSVHQRITGANYIYPHILESFHYMDRQMLESIQRHKRDVFLDSGAFSAFTMDVKLDIDRYARFLKSYKETYHVASNVDVIGAGQEQATYDNQKKLENLAGPGCVQPVYHVRDDVDWLRRYMDEGYDYIFIGGMVPENVPSLREHLDKIWPKYLANADGTPKIKVHGFGLTTEELMFAYPWYSVDSTAWVLASGFGICPIDLPHRRQPWRINFSEHASSRYNMESTHFWSLKPAEKERIRERLEVLERERLWIADEALRHDFKNDMGTELAYTPEALAKSYGLRRVLNMDYYLRASEQRASRVLRMQETLF
jgi:hypothetical protein